MKPSFHLSRRNILIQSLSFVLFFSIIAIYCNPSLFTLADTSVTGNGGVFYSSILQSATVDGSIWLLDESSPAPSTSTTLPVLTVDYIVSSNAIVQFLGPSGTKAQMVTVLHALTKSLSSAYRRRFAVKMIGYVFQSDTYNSTATEYTLGTTSYFNPSSQPWLAYSNYSTSTPLSWIWNLRSSVATSSKYRSHLTFYFTPDALIPIQSSTAGFQFTNAWVLAMQTTPNYLTTSSYLGTQYAVVPVFPFSSTSATAASSYEVVLWNMLRGISFLADTSSFSAAVITSGTNMNYYLYPSPSSQVWSNSNIVQIYNWLVSQPTPTCGALSSPSSSSPSFNSTTMTCNEAGLLCNYCQLGSFTTTSALHTSTTSNILTPWCLSPQCCDVTFDPTIAMNKMCMTDSNVVGSCNIFGSCVPTTTTSTNGKSICAAVTSSTNTTVGYFSAEDASDVPTVTLANVGCQVMDSTCQSTSMIPLNAQTSPYVGCSTGNSPISGVCTALDTTSTSGVCSQVDFIYTYFFHFSNGTLVTTPQLAASCVPSADGTSWTVPSSISASCYLALGGQFSQIVDDSWCVLNNVDTLSRVCDVTSVQLGAATQSSVSSDSSVIQVASCAAAVTAASASSLITASNAPCGSQWSFADAVQVLPSTCTGTIGQYTFSLAATPTTQNTLPAICSDYIADTVLQCNDDDATISSNSLFFLGCPSSDFTWQCYQAASSGLNNTDMSQNTSSTTYFTSSIVSCDSSNALAIGFSLSSLQLVSFNSPICVFSTRPSLGVVASSFCADLTIPTTGVNSTQSDLLYTLDTSQTPIIWYDVTSPTQSGLISSTLLDSTSACYLRTLHSMQIAVQTTTVASLTKSASFLYTLSSADIAALTTFAQNSLPTTSLWVSSVIAPWAALLPSNPFVQFSGCDGPVMYCDATVLQPTSPADNAPALTATDQSVSTVANGVSLTYMTWDGYTDVTYSTSGASNTAANSVTELTADIAQAAASAGFISSNILANHSSDAFNPAAVVATPSSSIAIQQCASFCPTCSNGNFQYQLIDTIGASSPALYFAFSSTTNSSWPGFLARVDSDQLALDDMFILPCQNFSSCNVEPLCWDTSSNNPIPSQALCDAIVSASPNASDVSSAPVPCSNQCGSGNYQFSMECAYVDADDNVIDTQHVKSTSECEALTSEYSPQRFPCSSTQSCLNSVEWRCTTSPSLAYSAAMCSNSTLQSMCSDPCSPANRLKIAAGISLSDQLHVYSQCTNRITGTIVDNAQCEDNLDEEQPSEIYQCGTVATSTTGCCSSIYQYGSTCQDIIHFTPNSFSLWGNVDLIVQNDTTVATISTNELFNLTALAQDVSIADSTDGVSTTTTTTTTTAPVFVGQTVKLEWDWNGPSYLALSISAQFDSVAFPLFVTQTPSSLDHVQFDLLDSLIPPNATTVQFIIAATSNTTLYSSVYTLINRCNTFNPSTTNTTNLNPFLIVCENEGICQASTGSCECLNGFTGSRCQDTICDSLSCPSSQLSDITCIITNTAKNNTPFAALTTNGQLSLVDSYSTSLPTSQLAAHCHCTSGFHGSYCQYSEQCNPNGNTTSLTTATCSNHGFIPWSSQDVICGSSSGPCTCTDVDIEPYHEAFPNNIIVPGTWNGTLCDDCHIACQNGGIFDSLCMCACLPGFYGEQCHCANMTVGINFLLEPNNWDAIGQYWSAAFISDLAADLAIDRSSISFSHINSTATNISSSSKSKPFTAYFVIQVCGDLVDPQSVSEVSTASMKTMMLPPESQTLQKHRIMQHRLASSSLFTQNHAFATMLSVADISVSSSIISDDDYDSDDTEMSNDMYTSSPVIVHTMKQDIRKNPHDIFAALAASSVSTSYNPTTTSTLNNLYNTWAQLPSTPTQSGGSSSGSSSGDNSGDSSSSGSDASDTSSTSSSTYMGSGTAGTAAGGVSGVSNAQTNPCVLNPTAPGCTVSNPFAVGSAGGKASSNISTIIIIVVVVAVGSCVLIGGLIAALCVCSRYQLLCFEPTNPDDLCILCQRETGLTSQGSKRRNPSTNQGDSAAVRSSHRLSASNRTSNKMNSRSCKNCGEPIQEFSTEMGASAAAQQYEASYTPETSTATASTLSASTSSQNPSSQHSSRNSLSSSNLPVQLDDRDDQLHSDWAKMQSPDGKIYFCNTKTMKTSWTRPNDDGSLSTTEGLFF